MAATYKGLLTNNGKALIASATLNNKINYSHIAVGDGNGSVPNPLETRTALVNEKARIALNVVEINPNNTNQIKANTFNQPTETHNQQTKKQTGYHTKHANNKYQTRKA